MEAIALRVEAIALRLEAIAIRLEAIAISLVLESVLVITTVYIRRLTRHDTPHFGEYLRDDHVPYLSETILVWE